MSSASVSPAPWRRARVRWRWPRFLRGVEGIVGAVLLALICGVAIIGPLVAPHNLAVPIGVPGSGPMRGAPLGTDFIGRDVLSRVLHGGWSVLSLSVVTTAFTYLLGISVGMVAGLARSGVDPVLMRSVDVLMSFPPLLLLLVLITGGGTGKGILIVGIVLVLFPGVARIVRTATLEKATTGYVEAAVGRGERLSDYAPRDSPEYRARHSGGRRRPIFGSRDSGC